MTKQISLAMPETLFEASKEYSKELGYRSMQEFVLELVRNKVIVENIERYRKIEDRMKAGIGMKKVDRKGAARYLKEL